jgi:hypothetical protein
LDTGSNSDYRFAVKLAGRKAAEDSGGSQTSQQEAEYQVSYLLAGSCEHGNELSHCMKVGKFVE